MMDSFGIKYLPGNGTFYFFVSIGDFPASSHDLALYLLLFHNIATVPGSAYGASTERFLRISIGAESDERIADALALLYSVLHSRPDISSKLPEKLASLDIAPFNSVCD
jgi:aspartate aminotransferase/aminotransferase